MSRYTDRDADDLRRDLVIATFHPDFRDAPLLEGLRAVRRDRGEWV
jgi:hypothetical protein